MTAIINPVELEYEDTVQQIRFCAEIVSDLARSAQGVEIRDIHVHLQLQQRKLQEMYENMIQMQQSLEDKSIKNLQIATCE